MSATDELRRMLDERGVEWADGDASHTTEWTNANGQKCSAMYWKPTLTVLISGCTPEQAIAATLGNELNPDGLPVIARCRDCKFSVDNGKYCAEGCADSWDWRNVEPDGFCAWGERRES